MCESLCIFVETFTHFTFIWFMITLFTPVAVKDLQRLQGIASYECARRDLVAIRDSFAAQRVLVWHLCKYFALPESEVLKGLK